MTTALTRRTYRGSNVARILDDMISRLKDMMDCEDENRDSETCCEEMVSNYEEHDVWQELHTLRELVRMIDPDKWTSDYVPPVTDEIEEILESVS